MNIKEKIKEINSQPENVRMRYVWGCVAVSMLIIFVVWIFSIVSMFSGKENRATSKDNSDVADLQKQFQDIKEQAPSLKALGEQSFTAGAEDNTTKQNTNTYQNQTDSSSEIPQSETYSKLPAATPQQ
jgi:hypothetical protein